MPPLPRHCTTVALRRAQKHAPHPTGRAGLPGQTTSHPNTRAHHPTWLALAGLAALTLAPSTSTTPTPLRHAKPHAHPQRFPTDPGHRPGGRHRRHTLVPPLTHIHPDHAARHAPPLPETLEGLSRALTPARAHLLSPPAPPALPPSPAAKRLNSRFCPPSLELYSPLAPHNTRPLPRTRASPAACHRDTTPHALTAAHSLPPSRCAVGTAPAWLRFASLRAVLACFNVWLHPQLPFVTRNPPLTQ